MATLGEEPKRWELLTDDAFIGSGIDSTALVGFLEFKDDCWLVCSLQGESSGSEDLQLSSGQTPLIGQQDLDDIPF